MMTPARCGHRALPYRGPEHTARRDGRQLWSSRLPRPAPHTHERGISAALPGSDRGAPEHIGGLPVTLPERCKPVLGDELPLDLVDGVHPLDVDHVVALVALASRNADVDAQVVVFVEDQRR